MTNVNKYEKRAGYLFLILGLLSFLFPLVDAAVFFYTLAALCTLSSVLFLIRFFKEKRKMNLVYFLLTGVLAVFLWTHRSLSRTLIVWFFSFYMLFNTVVFLIQSVLDFKEKSKNLLFNSLMTILYAVLAWFSIFYAKEDVRIIMYYFAIYLLIMAFEMLRSDHSVFDARTGRSFLMRYWITMPVYFVFLLPSLFLRRIDAQMKVGDHVPLFERKNDKSVQLRVYIHTGLTGEHIAGHMTISADDIMYSYGNYDAAREKLFRTVGPGIFFTVPAKPYVNNSCVYEGSVLFEYGLHLTKEQLDHFYQLVDGMINESERWLCPIEAQAQGHLDFPKYEKDYASRLYYRTGAKFREFKSGQWKNYWLFGENCSVFGENVLKELGLDILPKIGIATPGEYFAFLEQAYQDPDSCVITKSWHSAQYPQTLFDTIA